MQMHGEMSKLSEMFCGGYFLNGILMDGKQASRVISLIRDVAMNGGGEAQDHITGKWLNVNFEQVCFSDRSKWHMYTTPLATSLDLLIVSLPYLLSKNSTFTQRLHYRYQKIEN